MERKNLCAQIPITLHQRVAQGKEASDCQTLGDYITEVLTAYYDYIEHKGESSIYNSCGSCHWHYVSIFAICTSNERISEFR